MRRYSRRQTPPVHRRSAAPETFRTVAIAGEPVHAVDWATDRLHAPCGAWTFLDFRERDRSCPPEPTCPVCLGWKAAQPKPEAS